MDYQISVNLVSDLKSLEINMTEAEELQAINMCPSFPVEVHLVSP